MKTGLRFGFAIFVAVIICAASSALRAEVRLPGIFSSNMVLQRNMGVPIWGWAEPGENVSVSFEGQNPVTQADASGRWEVRLNSLKPGGPFTMIVKGRNELKLENILVGDVWLCSGQSNMEWRMSSSPDSKADIPNVNQPNIRLFQVKKAWEQRPAEKLDAVWTPCNPETVTNFSAVGYYFGKNLHENLDVPIGLINSSWGGTRIEPWTTPDGFKSVESLSNISREIAAKDPTTPLHKELVAKTISEYGEWIVETKKNLADSRPVAPPPSYPGLLAPWGNVQSPTVLYNGMIHPLTPLSIKGVIWYQGEGNLGEGMMYAEKMKALITGWRLLFNNPELGFYYAQLAPYDYSGDATLLPLMWEAQASIEKTIHTTGMAVINDIGNLKDIHPAHKSVVGKRLALQALYKTYNRRSLAALSPEFKEMKVDGKDLVISFDHAKELKTRDGKAPDWFEIAGADGVYQKAEAKIEGTTVRLSHASVAKPYAVRFAWSQLAEPNLQNEAGLQLGAFRAGEFPERGTLDALIPDAKNFELLYSFDPTAPVLADNKNRFVYKTDKSRELVGKPKRVAYFMFLKPKDKNLDEQYVFVTMPALDVDLAKLGVPVKASGARYQKKVSDVTVISNVPGIETGTFAEGCNVEFWDCNYGTANAAGISAASDDIYDFGDETSGQSPGYGSMQVHNFAKKQTIFAFNNFGAGNSCDTGIGNCSTGNNPDWTFSGSAKNHDGGQFMILVEME